MFIPQYTSSMFTTCIRVNKTSLFTINNKTLNWNSLLWIVVVLYHNAKSLAMSKGLGEHFNSLDLGLTKPEIDDPLITLVVLVQIIRCSICRQKYTWSCKAYFYFVSSLFGLQEIDSSKDWHSVCSFCIYCYT